MCGLFAPQTVLFDAQMATRYSMDPGTEEAAKSCTVVEVLVKDDTSVKLGDPLFYLYRPLPPSPFVTPQLFEDLKIKIKEELEEKSQNYQPATIVVDDTPPMPIRLDAGPQLLVNFKKFDTVVDYSDHLFSAPSSSLVIRQPSDWLNENYYSVVDYSDNLFSAPSSLVTQQPSVEWVNKIQEDRRILMAHLPDTIFVRVYESRMDILRAAIIGQKRTPYHNGLFFFDVCFPKDYPNSSPLVRYHSGVPGISPHLNKCGDVRLFIVNELGRQERMWIPGTSNIIQLLVFLQDLILSARPLFNIREAATSTVDLFKERKSLLFNENILVKSLETMVYTMRKPPKNFEDLVLGHFHTHVHDILTACKGYIEGDQQEVMCVVSDSNHEPSIKFKKDVISCIKPLVEAFDSIGAKEAREYLYLAEEKSASPAIVPNVPTPVDEDVMNALNLLKKVAEEINPGVEKKKKMVVKETSDPTEENGKVDVDVIDALKLVKKVADEIIAVVNEKINVVVVDEGTKDLANKKRKVPEIDIDPPHSLFTIRASKDCVIAKVLVTAGTKVEKGQPLYVIAPRRYEDYCLNICSRKESKVEYLMTHRIMLMNRRSHVGIFSMEDVLVDHHQQLEDSSPMALGLGDEEDVRKNFENFKKFDYVKEISDHLFSFEFSAQKDQPSKEWADRIHEDWATLEKNLPENIYVRVDKSRIDLLRAVIIGPQGTPYCDGLFFFDVCFPSNYPSSPPLVHYHSGGFCINPNLDKCGKVNLSLPKTTTGSPEMTWETMWVPGTSTLLDLLVSIQNRILTTKPVYNDFTYATMRGSVFGEMISSCYNQNINVKSLKTMVHVMKKQPKAFEDFVVGHFREHVRDILVMCTTKVHSIMFKDDLTLCLKLLIAAFNGIGAKVPEEFLP